MIRYLLPILLIVVPLVSYAVWYKLSRENKELREKGQLPQWRDAPWTMIVIGTLASMAVAMALFAILDGGEPTGVYTPPSYVDGEIQPSQVGE
ncbi:MAG: hypothetical protein AAF563_19045 [Pseudomonadota bacterium]